MTDRYQVTGIEGEYEPGSDGQVLRNRVGIRSATEMDALELQLLQSLYGEVLFTNFPNRLLRVADLMDWHRMWLGNVYEWAGQQRSVNIGKDGFQFAAAGLVPGLLDTFERDCLRAWTPCTGMAAEALARAIATTHVEFVLIHPFREGNGRLARLLADVMAVQAGFEPLDYSTWERDKATYIAAIHAGLGRDYQLMTWLTTQALSTEPSGLSEPR
jgi:cell filamentation protein